MSLSNGFFGQRPAPDPAEPARDHGAPNGDFSVAVIRPDGRAGCPGVPSMDAR
jgi:hypothetical protein